MARKAKLTPAQLARERAKWRRFLRENPWY